MNRPALASPPAGPAPHPAASRPTPRSPLPDTLLRLAFWTFVALILLHHALDWASGPFTWGARLVLPLADPPWQLGPLALLPLLPAVGLLRQWRRGAWTWGSGRVTGPLLLFTAVSLPHAFAQRQFAALAALGLGWFVYLGALNLRRGREAVDAGLLWTAVLVLVVQAGVAVAQFVLQRDLGLRWLGEPPLDPAVSGISVVFNDGARWLRGYGLNSHPNRLGMKLVLLLLLAWPGLAAARGWRQALIAGALLAGAAGLLVSLSRSAWLALAAGAAVYAVIRQPLSVIRKPLSVIRKPLSVIRKPLSVSRKPISEIRNTAYGLRHTAYGIRLTEYGLRLTEYGLRNTAYGLRSPAPWLLLLAIAGLALFLAVYGDALFGRLFRLDSSLESRSLSERGRDVRLALALLAERPWLGVGLGQFVPAAKQLDPFAGLVHVVPLIVAAEMGLPALAAWLLFLLLPLTHLFSPLLNPSPKGEETSIPAAAVWLAMIVVSLLQPDPHWFTMQGAVLLGLAAAQWPAPPADASDAVNQPYVWGGE